MTDLTEDDLTLVGIEYVAEKLCLSKWTLYGAVLGGNDPRVPMPLDLPGKAYRWRKRDVLAHIAALPTKGRG